MKKLLTILLILSSATTLLAEPLAPILKEGLASKKIAYLIKRAEKENPEKQSVPVMPYPGSKLFDVTEIPSASDTFYQLNKTVSLATSDTPDAVLKFYTSQLSGWKKDPLKEGTHYFLKDPSQRFWGGNKPLAAPRVEVISLVGAKDPASMSVRGAQLKEAIPSMNTLIVISYEANREKLLAVDIPKLVAGCEKQELQQGQEKLGNANPQAMTYLKSVAKKTCNSRVEKRCVKDPKGRFCQRYARIYS